MIGKNPIIKAASLFAAVAISSAQAQTQTGQPPQPTPKQLDALSEASVLQDMSTSSQGSQPLPTITISGNRVFDGYYLQAEKIIFKSGSVLTFSKAALGIRNNLFLIAKDIVSEDAAHPGTITFEHPSNMPTPAMPGQAPSGGGGGHRQRGGQGSAGTQGVAGPGGAAAPNLTIALLQVDGAGAIVDLRGGDGGNGGQGQKGGDGGPGGSGDNASQNCCNCNHGAENGYPGGQGGPGGPGGTGGQGGNGGTFTLLAPSDSIPSFLQKFRPMISAGQPGGPGTGGPNGNGGPGGTGGADARPWCVGSGSQGSTGPIGPTGAPGQKGITGVDGDIFVGAVTTDQFNKIYKID